MPLCTPCSGREKEMGCLRYFHTFELCYREHSLHTLPLCTQMKVTLALSAGLLQCHLLYTFTAHCYLLCSLCFSSLVQSNPLRDSVWSIKPPAVFWMLFCLFQTLLSLVLVLSFALPSSPASLSSVRVHLQQHELPSQCAWGHLLSKTVSKFHNSAVSFFVCACN